MVILIVKLKIISLTAVRISKRMSENYINDIEDNSK